ncbi:MAG TPA: hypothetical protein VGB99_16940 [Acidobacteriota bacterium]
MTPAPTIAQLIRVPAAATLAVTLLRVVGELMQWSPVWFNPAPGGFGSIVGIVWLVPLFGTYFARRLGAVGSRPERPWRAVGLAVLGAALLAGGVLAAQPLPFKFRLPAIWAAAAVAALLQRPAWPALFKTLLAYGFAARIPVAILILFALLGDWGTHYDALPPGFEPAGLWPAFFWLGLMPQLVAWVGLTVVLGALFGTVAAALRRRPRS